MALECGRNVVIPFLISINVVLFTLAFGVLIIGAMMKSDVSSIKDETKTVLNSVKSGDSDLGNLADNLSTLFIVVGVFISLVSGVFVGVFILLVFDLRLCGDCKQTKVLLYAVSVLVLFVIKIVAISLWFRMKNDIEANLRDKLVDSLHKNFVSDSISGGNDFSNGWNRIFISLDCCAVNNVASTTNDFDNTPWCTTSGECQLTNAEIPKACCVGVTETNYTSAPISCFYNLNSGTYNTKGCYESINDLLEQNITSKAPSILGVGITIILAEVLCVISAIVICSNPTNRKLLINSF
ncbi:CD63 antigen-like isoform X2 [Saccostrea echinata]|uniref:CD63 antigen-like isoform X2 n=1 Tax=Saccostrea echinata TaxID=191078 RepID=UPI002A7F6EBC|nr:CD63 antigen-like isoform X2 [Saccostrea echinata]